MSYILEALKKAQAERQLGNTPGIHDVAAPAPAPKAAPANARLLLALGAALLLVGAGVAISRLLARHEAPAPAAQPAPEPARAGAAPPPPPMPAPARAPAPLPTPAAGVVQAPAPQSVALPPPPAPAPVAPVEADDSLPTLAGLPPALASAIPRVTLGGYIYSPVPSERLLLVDKDLRREGEEVAPGLILEKLLPSAAVMSYRGTRFRMPY